MVSVKNVFDSFGTSFTEFRASKKQKRMLSVDVLYVYPNSMGDIKAGHVDDGDTFLFIDHMSRLYLDLHPIWVNGRRLFVVSSNGSKTIDIVGKLSQVANSWEGEVNFEYLGKEYKITGINGTINLTAFDNDFGGNFSNMAYQIITSKVMTFLAEVPKRVFILSCILAGVVGMVIGAVGMSMILGLLGYFSK